jgi:ribonuclease R
MDDEVIEGIKPLRQKALPAEMRRALMQARYSTENAGHFGLAFRTYCHFTSPIRRYPDLLVHRQLGLVLDGQAARAATQGAALEALSLSSSQREREAVAAERAMIDLKKAEFMLEHLLEPEPATIVGVAQFGFFVELEAYPVEGLVRAEDLPMQTTFDEGAQMLVARRSGERFRLGDRLVVEASNVSLQRRQISFALVERLTRTESAPMADRRGAAARKPRPTTERKARPAGKDASRGLGGLKVKKVKKKGKMRARAKANIGKRRPPRRPPS